MRLKRGNLLARLFELGGRHKLRGTIRGHNGGTVGRFDDHF